LQGSDVVGDDRIGTEFKCRLSVPQAKNAFISAQKESGNTSIDVALDFDEMLECIARCGVDKYRAVSQHMDHAAAVAGFIANVLGDANEEQVITKHTYVYAERFDAATAADSEGTDADWLGCWNDMQLGSLYRFPLWEREVHDCLKSSFAHIKSIFRAYAAGSKNDDASTMDLDEFHDFVIEADLLTKEYGFDTISGQFTKAIDGGDDSVMELHEFLTMIVRISFFRANPQYGMTVNRADRSNDNSGATRAFMEGQHGTAKKEVKKMVEIPIALEDVLHNYIFPHCRRDDGPPFAETLHQPDVHAEIQAKRRQLDAWFEMVSEGRQGLELKQWLDALEAKLLFSDLHVLEHRCRFTEPQGRCAFYSSAALPEFGLQPEELVECVARCAVDKYKGVKPMSKAQAIDGFLQNLFGMANEEEVIYQATGHGDPPESKLKRKPANPPKPKHARPAATAAPQPMAEEVVTAEEAEEELEREAEVDGEDGEAED